MIFNKHIDRILLCISLIVVNCQLSTVNSLASGGMWIMPNIPETVSDEMEEAGMEFDIESVYSDKSPSLKDATVYLTTGYTGTIVSKKGLMIAPYDAVKNNLPSEIKVDSGYVSPSIFKEVPLLNISAWILQNTKDVTYQVASHIQGLKDENQIKSKIDSVSRSICSELVLPAGTKAIVAPTSTGNYYLYQYKCYQDIRLAYMPPSSIANDNLKRERHSADFVMLRIYADRSNEPSEYDNSNQVYYSKAAATISINNYDDDDFVMALGYPNKTTRQILSADIIEQSITKPEARIKVMEFIDTLQYKPMSEKIKKTESEIALLKESGVIDRKRADENDFISWAANLNDFDKVLRYANVIPKVNSYYASREEYVDQYERMNFLATNISCINVAIMLLDMNDENEEEVFAVLNDYFVNLNVLKEKNMLFSTMNYLEQTIDSAVITPVFSGERSKSFKGNRYKYLNDMMSHSILTDEKRFMKYLDKPSYGALVEDPLIKFAKRFETARKYLYVLSTSYVKDIAYLTRVYREGQGLHSTSFSMAPDANYSLRMSYGKIAGFAQDDVHYIKATSSLSGVFTHSYLKPKCGVDSLMTELYESTPTAKKINITFMTNCDMATGRMGYGVYDYNGELLGIVTSSNAEALNNKYFYDGEFQRLVVLDMKYVSFVLGSYAKAGYILDEMNFGEVEKVVKIKAVEE